ncbi:MAG: exo-alpha-sialidase [Verrucomicrobiales bacterium]|nr:exo-alpha-sialidase [Verrucomicrobiales bacterium]
MRPELLLIPLILALAAPNRAADPLYEIEQTVARQGFDGKTCWVHARAGVIPPRAGGNDSDAPLAVMTLQQLDLAGSDLFYALNTMRSSDLGKTWSAPVEHESFSRRPFAWKEHQDLEITVCDFWPKWHAASGKLLGIGHTAVYEKNAVAKVRPRETPYSVYDAKTGQWSPWKTLKMPDEPKFENAGAGCVQRFDLEDGTVLLPIYFKSLEAPRYSVTVVRCSFDGSELRYLGHGDELTVPIGRGLYEPSLTRWGGRFYLTLRNDESGYVSVSEDGQDFSEPVPWCWDDGTNLGNYNTQQHWVTHREAVFLVYTRRGADNDHVMRHRAPLFIARVDPETLRIVRSSEQVLVPEHGARLGNFGVTEVNENETWVTVTEWMQAPGPNYSDPAPLVARGADNRVWVAKVKWTKPNR